jgi:hypothetical protein
MVHNQRAQALVAYEATLLREPNRARTLVGAARAARAAGKNDVATRAIRSTTRAIPLPIAGFMIRDPRRERISSRALWAGVGCCGGSAVKSKMSAIFAVSGSPAGW